MNTKTFGPFTEIGLVESPFRERFGIPRQAALVPEANARVVFEPDTRDALSGLDGFSHAWLITAFHTIAPEHRKSKVRPPRLGGDAKVGVLATRSPHRPNPIGLSLVEIVAVDVDGSVPSLHFRGCDLLDQTPVLDVKPYVDYADRPTAAVRHGWLRDAGPPTPLAVRFTSAADEAVRALTASHPGLRALIERFVALDPRPPQQRGEDANYGARLYDFDVRWRVDGRTCTVERIVSVSPLTFGREE